MSIIYLEQVNSTNTYIKENKLNNGDIVYTFNQTNGRGRLGRTWYGENALALSLLHIPKETSNLPVVSIIFGTAVCVSLKEITSLDLKIKWPNDIVIDGKKLCGVLVEAVTDNDGVCLICGVGINISNKDFPEDIKDKATSLKLLGIDNINIEQLIKAISVKFNKFLENGYKVPESFNDLCITLKKEILVINNGKQIKGIAKAINEQGGLIVKTTDKNLITVTSGEVSVRGILGYI